jgi:hypothetical protein
MNEKLFVMFYYNVKLKGAHPNRVIHLLIDINIILGSRQKTLSGDLKL